MKFASTRLPLLGAAASLLLAGASAQTVCSQNFDDVLITPGSVACNTPAAISVENQFLRRFSAAADCSAPNGHLVHSVTWGAEASTGGFGAGSQPISIRVYSIPTGDAFLYANMTLVSAVENIPYADDSGLVTTVLDTPACIFPGHDTVLEIAKLTGEVDGHTFFPASNAGGQSADCFLAAGACGITDPLAYAAIGFPAVNLILYMEQSPLIGSKFCGPNTPNSLTLSADILAVGSDFAADNDLTLQVKNLPNNSMGFFFISDQQFTVVNPGGSLGDMCIASFTLGRYDAFVLNSGTTNAVSLTLNLTQTPLQPAGMISIAAGETWNWQYWYRDTDMAGMAVSNFSDALSVTFQ